MPVPIHPMQCSSVRVPDARHGGRARGAPRGQAGGDGGLVRRRGAARRRAGAPGLHVAQLLVSHSNTILFIFTTYLILVHGWT